MSKINKVNFDGAYLRSSSGHFYVGDTEVFHISAVCLFACLFFCLMSRNDKQIDCIIFKQQVSVAGEYQCECKRFDNLVMIIEEGTVRMMECIK